jgi:hypothetical protein
VHFIRCCYGLYSARTLCIKGNQMKQMFAIIASGGSYEDAWDRAEFVTDDEDKGRAYCEKMNALSDAVKSANLQVAKWTQHYLIDHPRPAALPFTEVTVPKWKGSDKITPEMRAERKRIQDTNDSMRKAAYKPIMDHNQTMYEAGLAYKATFPEDVRLGMDNGFYDTSWEIEPINWLE